MLFLVSLIIILIQIISIRVVLYEQKIKLKYQYHYSHEMKFTKKLTLLLIVFGFIVGFLANILGLGGGFVMFPMFVLIGVSPLVSSACTMFLILLSKIVASIFAFLSGYLLYDYTFITVILVMLSVIFFVKVMDKLIKK